MASKPARSPIASRHDTGRNGAIHRARVPVVAKPNHPITSNAVAGCSLMAEKAAMKGICASASRAVAGTAPTMTIRPLRSHSFMQSTLRDRRH